MYGLLPDLNFLFLKHQLTSPALIPLVLHRREQNILPLFLSLKTLGAIRNVFLQ